MKPIATALNIQHGEKSYYGYLAPTVFSLQHHLEQFSESDMTYLHNMSGQLKICPVRRFSTYFRSDKEKKAITATFLHSHCQL